MRYLRCVFLGFLLSVCHCIQGCSKEGVKPHIPKSFTVRDAGGWWAEVLENGSGSIGFGSSGGDVALLPKGTFETQASWDELLVNARPSPLQGEGSDNRCLTISYISDAGASETLYSPSYAPFVSLLKRGIDSSRSQRLAVIWSEKAPPK